MTTLKLRPRVLEALQQTLLRVQPLSISERFWEQTLSREDRRRLGGDFFKALRENHDVVGMWAKLRGTTHDRALVEAGFRIGFLTEDQRRWLLCELGEVDENREEMIAAAVDGGGLVIVVEPRAAYWQKRAIEVAWGRNNACWTYLLTLARRAKAGKPLDLWDFRAELDTHYLTKMKSRLKRHSKVPSSLVSCIECEPQSQRLILEPSQIRIFELETVTSLREATA